VNFVRKNKRSNRTETVISKTQSNENRDTIKIGDTYVNVERSLSSEKKDKLEELILELKDIFALDDKTLGKCTVDEHAIDLIDPNQIPIKRMPYKYSPALRAEINRQVQEWLDLDIIEPCNSPWSFPVVLVDKKTLDKNGRPEKRVCVDVRPLNKVIKNDAFPVPDVQTSIEAIGEAEAMSLLDYKYRFLQKVIRVRPRHSLLCNSRSSIQV
jgi:hypothetical protein